MNRTYVFGCHEQIEGLRTFAVNVSVSAGQPKNTVSAQAALDEAARVAQVEGLPNPTLLYEDGTPELKVILNRGEVESVYYRNSSMPPTVQVIDLDYEPDSEKAGKRLLQSMTENSYTLVPHLLGG